MKKEGQPLLASLQSALISVKEDLDTLPEKEPVFLVNTIQEPFFYPNQASRHSDLANRIITFYVELEHKRQESSKVTPLEKANEYDSLLLLLAVVLTAVILPLFLYVQSFEPEILVFQAIVTLMPISMYLYFKHTVATTFEKKGRASDEEVEQFLAIRADANQLLLEAEQKAKNTLQNYEKISNDLVAAADLSSESNVS